MSVDALRNQLANLPSKALRAPLSETETWTWAEASHVLNQRQTQINLEQAARIASLENRIICQILPAVITLTIATALYNVASFFSSNPKPVADGTNENCTKAVKDFEACKGAIPTLQARRKEAMADWTACLNNLAACKNSTNETLANYNDALSQLEACKNSTNSTVN